MIALASDHGGFFIKEAVKKHFDDKKIIYKDFGTYNESSVDYPVYAYKLAKAVAQGECNKGILCCGTGIGVSIVANKVKGIRAALCTNEFCAEMARKHNNANVLCMGGRVINETTAIKLADIFLNTEFEAGRHLKRVNEISSIENKERNVK